MRVSQGMISNNMLRNISNSYGNLNKYMNQLSTGKKITRPSDDPVIAMKGMSYRSQLSNIQQYERNMGEVNNWLDSTDEAMNEVTLVLHRINDLTVQASNDTNDEDDRANIAKEVDQLLDQLVNLANTRVNDKYLFNGTDTSGVDQETGEQVPPFVRVTDDEGATIGFESSGNQGDVLIEVSAGVRFKVNTAPQAVFSEDLFDDIQALINTLNSEEDLEDINFDEHLENIEGHLNNTLNERAEIGARMNRVELIENRLANQSVNAEAMMSDNEDVDTAEVIMNLTMQEAIHRASLSAGARVLQPSLLDFLR